MKAGFLADQSGTFITKTIVSSPKLKVLEKVLLAALGKPPQATSEGSVLGNSVNLQHDSAPLCMILLASFLHKQYFDDYLAFVIFI